jgi:anti-sigma factor RsiW
MICAETTPLLELALDGELDARTALQVEEHLASCKPCAAQFGELTALQKAVRQHLTRYEPPASLRRELFPQRRRAILAGLSAAVAAAVVFGMLRPDPLADEVAAAHFRSLQANHLLDVVTSDQHTVKPWFQGKVDFGVPVRDLAQEGFPLLGGRVDYLGGHPAAAVVYGRAAHRINVFVFPDGDAPRRSFSRRGFNEVRFSKDGLTYWLVSDVALGELERLASLL